MVMFTDLDKDSFKGEAKFSSDFKNISYADDIIGEISSKTEIQPDLYGKILLSLSEAINNAIVHGNQFDPEKSVYINYVCTNKQIEFSIKDEGEGFDYQLVGDPTEAQNIEKLSGRGVFIIINLADTVEFSFENGQIVKMTFIR
jgi:anti-sigma regulatory factor (Ser/Thr protein kinase)